MAKLSTLQHAYIYIYIYAVKLLSGPSLGVSKVIIWAKSMLLSGPSLFSHYQNRGFWRFFFLHSYHFVFLFCVQLFANFLKIAFFEKRVQKLGFPNFSVLSQFFEKSHFLGLLKHYKNRGFSRFLCFGLLKEKKKAKKNDNWNL